MAGHTLAALITWHNAQEHNVWNIGVWVIRD